MCSLLIINRNLPCSLSFFSVVIISWPETAGPEARGDLGHAGREPVQRLLRRRSGVQHPRSNLPRGEVRTGRRRRDRKSGRVPMFGDGVSMISGRASHLAGVLDIATCVLEDAVPRGPVYVIPRRIIPKPRTPLYRTVLLPLSANQPCSTTLPTRFQVLLQDAARGLRRSGGEAGAADPPVPPPGRHPDLHDWPGGH